MKDIRIINGKFIRPDPGSTLRALGMGHGSQPEEREKIHAAYERLLPEVKRLIVPKAALAVRNTNSERVFVTLLTLGAAVSDHQSRLIADGNQYDALILDAMATSAIFAFQAYLQNFVISICHEMEIGLCGSISPKEDQFPAFVRFCCRSVDSERTLGVRVTDDGAMLPQKSMCEMYRVSRDPSEIRFDAGCSACGNTSCMMRDAERGAHAQSAADSAKSGEHPVYAPRLAENDADPGRIPRTSDHKGTGRTRVSCPAGINVLEFLRRRNISVPAPCGGLGLCGQCRVRVVQGEARVTPEDARFLTNEELACGIRLACRLVPERGIIIETAASYAGEDISALALEEKIQGKTGNPSDKEQWTSGKSGSAGYASAADDETPEKREDRSAAGMNAERSGVFIDTGDRDAAGKTGKRTVRFGVAVDIGTTTLAGALLDLDSGAILATESGVNHQRRFGSDVVARTRAAVCGNGRELQEIIRADLSDLIRRLCIGRCQTGSLKKIVIAANTTMQHLLMGWDVHGLLHYPFRPRKLGGAFTVREVFGEKAGGEGSGRGDFPEEAVSGGRFISPDCAVTLISGISAYVGGDITAGIYASDIDLKGDISLLVDLGTNGELACGGRDGITVGSAAAGPALEGGNISCGVSSIPGAICAVRPAERGDMADPAERRDFYRTAEGDLRGAYHRAGVGTASGAPLFAVRTIGDQPPAGLCGTGVIELCAALLSDGLIDRTGKLKEPYFHEGVPVARKADGEWIRFTQQDVREVQLAKGAIRAGIECIRAGKNVMTLVLAGGFGYYLNPKSAAQIGLIPPDLADRAEAAGNTALRGAVRCLTDAGCAGRIRHIRDIAGEDTLANDPHFQEMFIRFMEFGE